MAEPELKRKPLRFPYVGALLCAACVGAAVWTWMRYSYAWQTTPSALGLADAWLAPPPRKDVGRRVGVPGPHRPVAVRPYVRVRGRFSRSESSQWGDSDAVSNWLSEATLHMVHDLDHPGSLVQVLFARDMALPADGSVTTLSGRVIHIDRAGFCLIDTRECRFTGASIAGLVVGAMGVFVFTVALRHWLRERRSAMGLEVP